MNRALQRTAGAMVLLATLGGCVSMDSGPAGGGFGGGGCGAWGCGRPAVPGVQGPHGEPVAMAMPYAASPPGAEAARAMMARSMPMDLVQASASTTPGA